MIPYLDIPTLKIGPLQFHVFGVFLSIGIITGYFITVRRGIEYGLKDNLAESAFIWVLIGSFITAHLADVFFYNPGRGFENPWELVKIHKGISSLGGFFGGILSLYIFSRIRKQLMARYFDALSLGLLAGWIFGRMGCFITHDHPGVHSDFFLAVAFPDGPRHDLGFYEFLFAIVLFIVFEFVRRRPLAPGRIAILMGLIYSPVRFFLDFLRANDARYLSLTPAQYGCIGLFLICIVFLSRSSTKQPS